MVPHKILHIIGGGELGGAEQHVLTLLTQLNPQQYTLSLACLVKGPLLEAATAQGIPARCFPMHHPFDLRPSSSLMAWSREQGIELFHTHGSRANLLGRWSAHKMKLSCVSTIHSSLRHDYLSPLAAFTALWLDRITLPWTTGLITVSDYLRNEVTGRGGKNVHTIYNGIKFLNPSHLLSPSPSPQRIYYRSIWQIPQDALVIGTLARLHPTKGQTYLIEAAKQLYARYPHLHLLIVGGGPLEEKLKKQLDEAHIPYTLPGFIPEGAQTLPAMDLFVLPSLSEGMGLVLLEAIHAGLPIVATQVGGIGEVVRNKQDALLVPPSDPVALAEACQTLIDNPALQASLIRSALTRLDLFSVQTMVKKTESFYDQILNPI